MSLFNQEVLKNLRESVEDTCDIINKAVEERNTFKNLILEIMDSGKLDDNLLKKCKNAINGIP